MIIFYNKLTGNIIGTIDGRVHDEGQLKVKISQSGVNDTDIEKIVCQWKPTGKITFEVSEDPIFEEYIDEEGFTEVREIGTKKKRRKIVEFEPDHKQKDIFILLDKDSTLVYKYKVDIGTGNLSIK